MPRKISALCLVLAAVLFMGQGCISFQKSGSEGGLLRSPDKGVNWEKKNSIFSLAGDQTLASVNVLAVEEDPSDAKSRYLITSGGVLATYNDGEGWQRLQGLGNAVVRAIAVDAKDKCTLYVALGKQMYKSTDCGRNFGKPIYDDPRADNLVNDIEVDSFNPVIVYASTSKGDILKSLDGGASWKIIRRFETDVPQILINQENDTRVLYVGTKDKGVWRTPNAGGQWESSEEVLRKTSGALEFRRMAIHKDGLILATKYGLLKSTHGNWLDFKPLNLLTAPGSAVITALTVNPKNFNEMYYGAKSTLYRTGDGGTTWATVELPMPSLLTALGVHPEENDTLYAGLTKIEE